MNDSQTYHHREQQWQETLGYWDACFPRLVALVDAKGDDPWPELSFEELRQLTPANEIGALDGPLTDEMTLITLDLAEVETAHDYRVCWQSAYLNYLIGEPEPDEMVEEVTASPIPSY